ncbi:hypothetical protein BN3662_01504 [Clostridiales bacterium CHKCI006]|nr:hypothetical protein BN3662_01504 [Clostridiales bacterium CHKCI006]
MFIKAMPTGANKTYCYCYIVESYRDGGKCKHKNLKSLGKYYRSDVDILKRVDPEKLLSISSKEIRKMVGDTAFMKIMSDLHIITDDYDTIQYQRVQEYIKAHISADYGIKVKEME